MWAEPDSNRRPFDYQSNAPAVLSYRPAVANIKVNIWLVNKNFRKPLMQRKHIFQGWARSLARIKVSAFGAGDRGFKSHRARSLSGSEMVCCFCVAHLYANAYHLKMTHQSPFRAERGEPVEKANHERQLQPHTAFQASDSPTQQGSPDFALSNIAFCLDNRMDAQQGRSKPPENDGGQS
jgi:hypothetical protein